MHELPLDFQHSLTWNVTEMAKADMSGGKKGKITEYLKLEETSGGHLIQNRNSQVSNNYWEVAG